MGKPLKYIVRQKKLNNKFLMYGSICINFKNEPD